jgi:hypothetical protein
VHHWLPDPATLPQHTGVPLLHPIKSPLPLPGPPFHTPTLPPHQPHTPQHPTHTHTHTHTHPTPHPRSGSLSGSSRQLNAEFIKALDTELSKVLTFYLRKEAELVGQLEAASFKMHSLEGLPSPPPESADLVTPQRVTFWSAGGWAAGGGGGCSMPVAPWHTPHHLLYMMGCECPPP